MISKRVKAAFAAAALLLSGTTLVSCDQAAVQQILTTVVSTLMSSGQTKVYAGKATSLSMTGSANKSYWNAINTRTATAFSSASVQLQSGISGTGTLVIPAFTDGKVTVNQITIYNLALTSSNNQASTNISIGDSSTIDGSIVVGGVTYTAANLYIETGVATQQAINLTMTLYFASANDGDDYSKAINYTFTGNITQ